MLDAHFDFIIKPFGSTGNNSSVGLNTIDIQYLLLLNRLCILTRENNQYEVKWTNAAIQRSHETTYNIEQDCAFAPTACMLPHKGCLMSKPELWGICKSLIWQQNSNKMDGPNQHRVKI